MPETVHGNLTDFGAETLTGLAPTITFTPSGPAIGGTVSVHSSRPITVTPSPDGGFTVELVRTDDKRPGMWFTITIGWLDAASNYRSFDFTDWKLTVPAGGGAINDLLYVGGGAPNRTWIGIAEPEEHGPFVSWMKVDPNNVDDYSPNAGAYYEWEG